MLKLAPARADDPSDVPARAHDDDDANPTIPMPFNEAVGFGGGKTIVDDYLRDVRPFFVDQRTSGTVQRATDASADADDRAMTSGCTSGSSRAAVLQDLAILDTPPEPAYDDLARLASACCKSEIAAVNFVDDERHWTKAIVGVEGGQGTSVSADVSFCAATVATESGFLRLSDTATSDGWREHPLVTGPPFVRFYAGVSIVVSGEAVGVVCVFGDEPRDLDPQQEQALIALAAQASAQLELRRSNAERGRLIGELQQRDLMLTGVVENNMTLIYVKDLDGRYLLYNQPFTDALDLDTRGAAEGRDGLEVLLGRDDVWLDPELQPIWRQNDLRAAEGSLFIEEWSDHPELGRLTFDSIKFPLVSADGEVYATCGVSLDTTERVRAIARHKEAEQRFKGAFEHAPIGMALVAPDHTIMRANDALAQTIGLTADELVGRSLQAMTNPEDVDGALDRLDELTRGVTDDFQHEIRLFNASGHTVWVLSSWSAVRDAQGALVHYIAQIKDISEGKLLEERLRRIADHDSLTGARTRRLFEEDLLTQLGRCQRYGELAALLVIDLDDFKQINDRYGHKAGDDTLRAVASTIKGRLRSSDLIARLGGDEFAVLMPHIGRAQAEGVVEALRTAIEQITISPAHGHAVRSSIGLAFIDERSADIDVVLAEADRAMYAAKRTAKVGAAGVI